MRSEHCWLNNNVELQINLKILNNHQFAIESNFEDNRATHSKCAMDAEVRFPKYCLLFLATLSDRFFLQLGLTLQFTLQVSEYFITLAILATYISYIVLSHAIAKRHLSAYDFEQAHQYCNFYPHSFFSRVSLLDEHHHRFITSVRSMNIKSIWF